VLNDKGIRCSSEKINELKNFVRPKTIRDLQRLLGSANFTRRYIRSYGELKAPLYRKLCRNGKQLICDEDIEIAYTNLINAYNKTDILCHHDANKRPFMLSDASRHGISAILLQTTLSEEELFTIITSKKEIEKTQGMESVNIFSRQYTENES
jgi:hypothetical protein